MGVQFTAELKSRITGEVHNLTAREPTVSQEHEGAVEGHPQCLLGLSCDDESHLKLTVAIHSRCS